MLSVAAAEDMDFYEVLELPLREESTLSEIKASFRHLSRKWHPDLHGGSEEASARYQRITRANDVLSNPKLRKVFDLAGHEGLRKFEEEQRQPQGQRGGFFDFFGGRSSTRGENSRHQLEVGLDDFYNGNTIQVNINKQKVCSRCKGSGAFSPSDFTKCRRCGGSGHVLQQMGFLQMQQPCDKCGGTGKMVSKKCPVCEGKKVVRANSRLELTIDPGAPNGHEVVFEMEGDQTPGVLPGDVTLELRARPHPQFVRDGNDLHTSMRITLLEALIGFSKNLRHMDDRDAVVAHVGVTQPGEVRGVKGEGMPFHNVPSERGVLHVKFDVVMPLLDPAKRDALLAILAQP